jgi:pyrophosphatase PpaX
MRCAHWRNKVSSSPPNCKECASFHLVDIRADYDYILQNWYTNTLIASEALMFSCVIFDMDGTLTQTNNLIFASFNHVANKYLGKTLTPTEVVALFGPPEEGGLIKLVGAGNVEVAMNDLCEFYREHHDAMAAMHPEMENVLHFLRSRGVRLAVFTGKGIRTATITLEAFNLAQYFDVVVSGTDVVHHKPHPEGINKVLSAFSLTPDQALMVGDALSDVLASRSAGVKMAAVVWDSYDKERILQAQTDYVFHTGGQMLDWFRAHTN